MAAITVNTNDRGKAVRFLEDITLTNQSGAFSKVRAVKVPEFARFASFYLYVDSQGGNTPTLDFAIYVPDFGDLASFLAPDDGTMAKLADFVGITQVTGTGPYVQTIDIGPGVTGIADDATGAAAADARMAVNTILPPWLVYDIDADGTTGDEDLALRVVLQFRK